MTFSACGRSQVSLSKITNFILLLLSRNFCLDSRKAFLDKVDEELEGEMEKYAMEKDEVSKANLFPIENLVKTILGKYK